MNSFVRKNRYLHNIKYAVFFFCSILPLVLTAQKNHDIDRFVLIKDGYLNLRQSPIDGKPVARLKAGEAVSLQRSENGWAYIKASQGRVGFVADRYLGRLHPDQLKNAEWWALADVWDENNPVARPLGFRVGNNYYGYNHAPEALYLMNTSPQPLHVFRAGKTIGEAQLKGVGNYGCGEHPAWNLQVTIKEKDESEHRVLLYSGQGKIGAELEDAYLHPSLQEVLKDSGDGWLNVSSKILIVNGSEEYLYAHLRLEPASPESDVMRRYQLYRIDDAVSSRDPLYSEEVTLSAEVDQYGGMDLQDILPSRQNELLLLFSRSGFDAVEYDVMMLKNKKLISLFRGGGDAC